MNLITIDEMVGAAIPLQVWVQSTSCPVDAFYRDQLGQDWFRIGNNWISFETAAKLKLRWRTSNMAYDRAEWKLFTK